MCAQYPIAKKGRVFSLKRTLRSLKVMSMKVLGANELLKSETKYVAAIQESLKEMADRHQQMKQTDAEIRQLRTANRRQIKEIRNLLDRVQTAI